MISAGTPVTGGVRVHVDPWDPTYGAALAAEASAGLAESTAAVQAGVELPPDRWSPLRPSADTQVPDRVFVVDGVRRIDARVWFEAPDADGPALGIAASWAAGVVRLDGIAEVLAVEVDRGVFTGFAHGIGVATSAGSYPLRLAADPTPDGLSLALQQRLAETEVVIAERARTLAGGGLLLVDGPLRGRTHLPDTVGYIKTHHAAYLPPELNRVVEALGAGERSPVFTVGTSWSRHCWYLRLPGTSTAPWAGVVRCESSADLDATAAGALADTTAALLPGLASSAHKDPRAPQNLIPIGGLERRLRHLLGDPKVLHRALVTSVSSQRREMPDTERGGHT